MSERERHRLSDYQYWQVRIATSAYSPETFWRAVTMEADVILRDMEDFFGDDFDRREVRWFPEVIRPDMLPA